MSKFFGRLDADGFLESMVDSGTATVQAKELRSLLQSHRRLIAKVKDLEYKNELLRSRNVSLKEELLLRDTEQLIVSNIDMYA